MRSTFLWIVLWIAPAIGLAADDNPCDRTAPPSEFSWNPGKQFISTRLARFYQLGGDVPDAYERGDDAELTKRANEFLELAAVYRCNWNYGNAIHDANRYLGLAALRAGNLEEAGRFLVLAGKTTGSPQLDSFGPELDLANQLLRRGKTETVTEYLRDVKRFWKMDDGEVDRWLAAISKGETPVLDRFSVKPSPWLVAVEWGIICFPAVLILTLLYFRRKYVRRKVIFIVVSLLSAYTTLFLLNLAMMLLVPRLIWLFASLGKLGEYSMVYLPPTLVLGASALVVFGVLKYFSSQSPHNAS